MANEEHLKILKQGVEVWNRWREENPGVEPDLSGADLRMIDLAGMDLSRAKLNKAKLIGATLSGTDLSSIDLSEADLRMASLGAAFARLYRDEDTFREVMWYAAGTSLKGAYLDGARLGHTVFTGLDLSEVKGLEAVNHWGPSFIDIQTIYRSHGKIPEAFLRGCGVPEDFITYVKSLTGLAIEYYSCFISYSSTDDDFAQRLHADLQDNAVRCWFAPEDLKIGDEIRPRIDQSIRLHDKLLVVLSEHSIHSDWVEDEVETAIEEERKREKTVLFPIRLDEAVMETDQAWAAKIRRTRHIGDFSQWKDHDSYQAAFDRLLRDLKAEEG